MNNPYQKGSEEWILFNEAEKLAPLPATENPHADAIDRQTIALHRIGAALVSSLKQLK